MSDPKDIKALVIDDERHIRVMVRALLASMGAQILGEASNGEEGIAQFRATNPNLVLMDINMPVMDGVTALSKIIEISPDQLVIMLTSLADMETIQACVDAGAAGYLRKDLPPAELKKAILDTWTQFNAP